MGDAGVRAPRHGHAAALIDENLRVRRQGDLREGRTVVQTPEDALRISCTTQRHDAENRVLSREGQAANDKSVGRSVVDLRVVGDGKAALTYDRPVPVARHRRDRVV